MKGLGQEGKHSFQRKLILSFLGMGLLPMLIVSLLYQGILFNKIVENSKESTIAQLQYMGLNIEKQIETSKQLLGQITFDSNLKKILTKDYEEDSEKVLDIIDFNNDIMKYSVNANIENSIFKILILGDNGTTFQMGNNFSLLDKDAIVKEGWLETYRKKDAETLVLSKDHYVKDTLVFPLSARIYSDLTSQPIGWCLLVFSNDMYSKCLVEGNNEQDVFLINQNGQCVGHAGKGKVGESLGTEPMIQEVLNAESEMGNIVGKYHGEHSILHYYHIPGTDLTEIEVSSMKYFFKDTSQMMGLLALFMCITAGACIVITMYLTKQFLRPIRSISDYIKKVPGNGFRGNLALVEEDEFAEIVRAINHMELEIQELIETQKQEAKLRNKLEFKVLQNQINPHFLYNTLNSIKWMATLQKNTPIRDMTGALGRLLQNISKGTAVKIPIYEEMSVLDDYILIQNVRYNGKIQVRYHITDKDITQAYILKFTIQPIIENAIFHGIEPKGEEGRIDIILERENNAILIHVADDGVGMNPEQIEAVLSGKQEIEHKRGLNGIGIRNIRDRIQMTYGKEYGLFIDSVPGEYTKVTIKIPYEKEG